MAHIHAENMKLYAEDAAMSDTPWDYWEFCVPDSRGWLQCIQHPAWNTGYAYRRISAQDSIDWDHVAPQYNWMARDACGDAYLFTSKPDQRGFMWNTSEGDAAKTAAFVSYKQGNTPWMDSLVRRP